MQHSANVLFGKLPDNMHDGIKHRVPARDEARLHIEFTVAPANGCDVGELHYPQGKHRGMIYASQLDDVKARVASDEQAREWKACEVRYEAMLAQWLVSEGFKNVDMTDADQVKALNHRKATYEGSPAKLFCQSQWRTGCPPLRGLKVLGDAPPPETETTRQRMRSESMIHDLAAAIREAVAADKPKTKG